MDYHTLNKEIVKDKFLIPMIDKLLDELWGPKVLSKLDLRFFITKLEWMQMMLKK